MPGPVSETETVPGVETDIATAFDRGWQVIVWDDPVNLMSYVVYVFRQVLGFNEAQARKHMLEVHLKGKSCVARETREKAELFWQRIQQFGLKVTLEKAGS
jgi:ATP-dependent Clp protease adaptor protein ClpS